MSQSGRSARRTERQSHSLPLLPAHSGLIVRNEVLRADRTCGAREGPSLRTAGGRSAKEARMQDNAVHMQGAHHSSRSVHELGGDGQFLSLKPQTDKLLACHCVMSPQRNPISRALSGRRISEAARQHPLHRPPPRGPGSGQRVETVVYDWISERIVSANNAVEFFEKHVVARENAARPERACQTRFAECFTAQSGCGCETAGTIGERRLPEVEISSLTARLHLGRVNTAQNAGRNPDFFLDFF